jgi:hypothetical protein
MICFKEKQNLTDEQRKNQRLDEKNKHKIRAKVEHRFAHIKTHMKQSITRDHCIIKNIPILF